MSIVNLSIHTLALMGIADHIVRDKQQYNKPLVVGAIFGEQVSIII